MTQLLRPHSPRPTTLQAWLNEPVVQQAADWLAQGRLLGLPTETVYGLAADANQPEAVARIFATKGRPADHPLIVHLPPQWAPGVAHHARQVPDFAQRLMDRFWPGPLTLILPRQPGVAEAAAGGQDSVGLRCPAHPAAQAVLQAALSRGVYGVAAPSANRFGRVSPTTAGHVMTEFAALDDQWLQVLDGGPCAVGIESTIVDATRGRPVLLRPGMLDMAALADVCGQALEHPDSAAGDAPRAPGTLASHYAPNAPVRLMEAADLNAALSVWNSAQHRPHERPRLAVYSRLPVSGVGVVWRPMPHEASACAQELFAVLRELDDLGVALIWVQVPPATADWAGVADRLQRAAA